MSHNLEIIDGGASMFYVGETPWHKLGKHFETPPSTEVALQAANMDWTVGTRPLYNEHGRQSTHNETYREDNGQVLGVVGPKYRPLQNRQAFGFFEPLVNEGILQYETAGVLSGGEKVWILAKANQDPMEIVKNDAVESYVLLSNSHDGTMAVRVGFTPIRVVCQNTLSMALSASGDQSRLLKVRHTTKTEDALNQIREIMRISSKNFVATAEQYKELARCQVTEDTVKKYVEQVFDLAPEDERKRTPQALTRVMDLFESGRGNDMPQVKGTAWAMYNGVVEYLQYEACKNEENRLKSLWFGQNQARNKAALDAAMDIVQAA